MAMTRGQCSSSRNAYAAPWIECGTVFGSSPAAEAWRYFCHSGWYFPKSWSQPAASAALASSGTFVVIPKERANFATFARCRAEVASPWWGTFGPEPNGHKKEHSETSHMNLTEFGIWLVLVIVNLDVSSTFAANASGFSRKHENVESTEDPESTERVIPVWSH